MYRLWRFAGQTLEHAHKLYGTAAEGPWTAYSLWQAGMIV